jgi:voltage-gated hydrogen channel 1
VLIRCRFFKSKFRIFDACVIILGFVLDVCLKGVIEEVGSIVIVLRLWRVFKIIEELSAGASEQMDALSEKIEKLEQENMQLKKELTTLRDDSNDA